MLFMQSVQALVDGAPYLVLLRRVIDDRHTPVLAMISGHLGDVVSPPTVFRIFCSWMVQIQNRDVFCRYFHRGFPKRDGQYTRPPNSVTGHSIRRNVSKSN